MEKDMNEKQLFLNNQFLIARLTKLEDAIEIAQKALISMIDDQLFAADSCRLALSRIEELTDTPEVGPKA
jgi:hypothetical protein